MNLFLGMMIFLIGGFSIWCNFSFYASFAMGINALALGIFGLVSDITKLVSAKTFSESLVCPNKKGAGLFGIFVWIITSTLSVIAGYGFLSGVLQNHENTQLKQSHVYENGLVAVSNARRKVEELVSYADSGNAEAAKQEKQLLQKELADYIAQPALNGAGKPWGTIAGRVGNCAKKSSYYVKAYCPKIKALETEIAKQNDLVTGYLRYTSATSYLEKTSLKLSDLTAGGGTIHAAFRDIGGLIGASPQIVKILVIGVLALVVEFSTSYFIYLATNVFGTPNSSGYSQETVDEQYENPRKLVGGSQMTVNKSFRKPIIARLLTVNDSYEKRFKKATIALTKTVVDSKTGKLGTELTPSLYGTKAWCLKNGGAVPKSTIVNKLEALI